MRKVYPVLMAVLIICLLVSCGSITSENNACRLFEKREAASVEADVEKAWEAYHKGAYATAASAFEAIINSGAEDFLEKRSSELGIRVGAGYSLLRCGRAEAALYQFDHEKDSIIESAVGAATANFLNQDYVRAAACFKAFGRLETERTPYKSSFNVTGYDINLEAHKLILMSLYSGNIKNSRESQEAHYGFIRENAAEIGLDEGLVKIFAESFKKR